MPPVLREWKALLAKARAAMAPRRAELPSGVVHGDLHFWNVLYAGHLPVAIVDLDFLRRGYLLTDLAYQSIWLEAWDRDRGGQWRASSTGTSRVTNKAAGSL